MKFSNRIGAAVMVWGLVALIMAPHSEFTTTLFLISAAAQCIGGILFIGNRNN